MSYFEDPLPNELHLCQDMALELMNEIEGIYGQLNDPDRRRRYKSDKDYQTWRNSAFNANAFKGNQLEELEAHMKTCFKAEYPTKLSLLIAIQDRQLKPPRWLDGDDPIESIPQIKMTAESERYVSDVLTRLIAARGSITQTEVGAVLGVSSSAVSSWEKGKSPITLNTILKMCQLYNVNPIIILTGKQRIDPSDVHEIWRHSQENADLIKSLLE